MDVDTIFDYINMESKKEWGGKKKKRKKRITIAPDQKHGIINVNVFPLLS